MTSFSHGVTLVARIYIQFVYFGSLVVWDARRYGWNRFWVDTYDPTVLLLLPWGLHSCCFLLFVLLIFGGLIVHLLLISELLKIALLHDVLIV